MSIAEGKRVADKLGKSWNQLKEVIIRFYELLIAIYPL